MEVEMAVRTAPVILALVLGATVALGTNSPAIGRLGTGLPSTLDIAVEISRPETLEAPGIMMAVAVKLTSVGDTDALVPRLDVTIKPSGYAGYLEGVPYRPGQVKIMYMSQPWVYGGGTETCTAWITYPDDMNHHNDTDVVIVNRGAGLSEGARTDLSKSLGRLTGSISRTTCFVNHTEPLNVTLFDIKGRAMLACHLGAARAGKSSLDLRGLRSGVYLAHLDDGRRSSFQKLVVQR